MYGAKTLNRKVKCLGTGFLVLLLVKFLISNLKLPDHGVHPQMILLQVQGAGIEVLSVQT